MALLKCPKCGRLCREGVVPFPRCARCTEHLLKCRYCAHFDPQVLDCSCVFRDPDFHLRDPDAYLACQYHKTTLSASGPQAVVRKRVWVPGAVLIIAALLVALVGGKWLYEMGEAPDEPPLQARFVPRSEELILEGPVDIVIQVWNPGPTPAEEVILALDRRFEHYMRLTGVEPQPTRRQQTSRTQRMWFDPLGQGEVLDVQLRFSPVRQGTFEITAVVMAPGRDRKRIETTLAITP